MIPRLLRAARLAALLCLVVTSARAADAPEVRLGRDVVPTFQAIRLHLDPDKRSYTGAVTVDLTVAKSTTLVRLHANGQHLTSVALTQGADTLSVEQAQGADGLLTLTAAKPLQVGKAKLAIEFSNFYGTRAVGLYRVVKDGRGYLYTQFESTDARQAFPCWDEPGFKFPYQVTLEIPAAPGLEGITNTPLASEHFAGGWNSLVFKPTPALPSYLLAVAVGPFEDVPVPGMSIPTRVITVQGQGHLAGTVVAETPGILKALEHWFGTPYPFEKLDIIAVPDFAYGAMENPGAITYRDDVLLVDPATLTLAQRRRLVSVHAHEMSHMWFGDLVTMAWWDDLWLNESFADWMSQKVTDEIHPEFHQGLAELQSIERTKAGDATPSTMAIRQNLSSSAAGLQNVGLVYQKGNAVLSMFESWMGPATFQKGVRAYLAAHARGNATASDLWAALDAASGRKISPALASYTDQPGVPYLRVVPAAGGVRITQSRCSHAGVSQPAELWKVPVSIKYSDGASVRTTTVLLEHESEIVPLPGAAKPAWVLPDAGGRGYYAWSVPQDMLVELARHARERLTPAERVAFLGDLDMLLGMGEVHGDTFLQALSGFGNDPEPQVVSSVIDELQSVRVAFVPDSSSALFARYVEHTLGPTLERIGYEHQPGEDDVVSTMRPQLINWMALRGHDDKALEWAQSAARRYLADSASVDPSMADVVLQLAAHHGDAALYETYRQRFEAAKVPAVRRRYLTAMGAFSDTTLESRVLNYVLGDKVLPSETFSPLMGFAGKSEGAGRRLWAWLTANYGAISAHVPPPALRFLPALGAGGCSEERLAATQKFFSDPSRGIPGVEHTLERVSDNVHDCIGLRTREGRAVEAYFQTLP